MIVFGQFVYFQRKGAQPCAPCPADSPRHLWDEWHHCLCWRRLSSCQVHRLLFKMEFPQILIPNFQHSCIWVESRGDFGTRASLESSNQRGHFWRCSGAAIICWPGDGAVAAGLQRPSFSADRSSWSGQARLEISFCFYSSVDIVFQGSTAYYVISHQTPRIADSVCASTRLWY